MSALLLAAMLASSPGPTFIEDDFARALSTARDSKRLLFVDAWAPWCHTCIYMREHVLNQAAFAPLEKEMVFAAVDTEKPGSAAFLEAYPVEAWPTLFFIDPSDGHVVLKWVGSADAAQVGALLAAARKKDARVGDADALMASGKTEEAARRYLAALKETRGDASARATLSTLNALGMARQNEACARTAVERLASLTETADRVTALQWGLGCALELGSGRERASLLDALLPQARAALKLQGVMADDTSGLYELLVTERELAKDAAGARAVATEWLAFLEAEAAKATTPAARAVFDPHRVSAALVAGVPLRVVDALNLSEKEFPADYNPPARLALAYRELGRLEEALAAADRALQRCQGGPRKIRLYENKASILEKKGDKAGRRKTLEEALAYARALPKAQRAQPRIAALEAALKK